MNVGLLRSILFVLFIFFFNQIDLSAKPEAEPILFIGSSTIEYWKASQQKNFPNQQIINLGKGGTQFTYLVENIQAWLEKYPVNRIVVYSGDNDLASGKKPEEVLQDFNKLIRLMRSMSISSKIYVFSVKPCIEPHRNRLIPEVKQLNLLMQKHIEQQQGIIYLDVFTAMTDDQGLPLKTYFKEDGIHLNETGYELWSQLLKTQL